MKRFPARQEIAPAFLTAIAVINFWAFVVFFYEFPGVVKHLTAVELLAVLSYILFSALIESAAIFVGFLLLSILLPAKLLRTDFTVRSAIILLLSTIYIIPFHLYIPRISTLIFEAGVSIFISLWTVLFLIELVLFHLIIPKYPHFTTRVRGIVDRIAVLGAIYLFIDLLALFYVIVANWS